MYFKTSHPLFYDLVVPQPVWKKTPHSMRSHHLHDGSCSSLRKETEAFTEIKEKEQQFQISIDVPGIKAKDLTVTMEDDGVLKITGIRKGSKFSKSFALDVKTIDTSQIKANLADGVLVVTALKKAMEEAQAQIINVTTEPHNDDEATEEDDKEPSVTCFPRYGCQVMQSHNEFQLAVDIPGVKASDLTVEFQDGLLRLSGQRQGRSKFYKNFAIDSQSVDTTQLKANLADGVLVLTAPKKKVEAQTIITVTEGPHDEEAAEKNVEPKHEETEVIVETVSPEDEDDGADVMEKGLPTADE